MIGVLWNIISYIGLVILGLAGIGTCILMIIGIISIIKEIVKEFKK